MHVPSSSDMHLRSRGADGARVMLVPFALQSEGAGNAGRPMRPIAACAMIAVERTRVSQVTPESPGIPRAMVYGLFRALPGDRLVDTVTGEVTSASLTPAPRRQDHTTSPSASPRSRLQRRLASTAPRPNVRDDRETPLVSAKSARMCERAVLAKPPVAGTEPVTPQRRQSLKSEQGTAPVVFLNPNSCKGFEPEPSKEGSG